MVRGQAVHPDFPSPPGEIEAVRMDARRYVEVDVTGDVTAALLTFIESLGGEVVNSFAEYRAVRARVALPAVEQIAGREEVQTIRVADPGHSNGGARRLDNRAVGAALRSRLRTLLRSPRAGRPGLTHFPGRLGAFFMGPDTPGDVAHGANVVRNAYGYDGTGISIGVLSDGTNSLAAEQAAGRLPAVRIIQSGNGEEGTALLEIVYSIAPGANLLFATATGGQANMARNIQALADAGCKIIIDDWTYFGEGVFQDDIVSKKVNAVSAAGVLYFTAAQNSGSLLKRNSGTWEGDFADSGIGIPAISAFWPAGGALHNFGTAANIVNADTLTKLSQPSFNDYELKWSDPLGASTNDYDLFILDSSLSTVLASSTNVQNGFQNPEELVYLSSRIAVGSRIVIFKHTDAAIRALHLDTERGVLTIATNGATFGHNAASGAMSLAAADVQNAHGGAFTGGSANPAYVFGSDGPRRMFFNADGTPITPGNFTFGTNGGTVLNRPDFTAADGVPTGAPGWTVFYGTSAAGAHAGAIAALVLQAVPGMSPTQMRAALTTSALDIEGPGPDINSGAGIIMAPTALAAALHQPAVSLRISHSGNFVQGQSGAAYTVTVGVTGGNPLTGTATVTGNLPSGLTLVSMSGTGWNCSLAICSRSDGLSPGASFPPIAIAANVSSNAPSQLSSQVSVAVDGVTMASASDPTIVIAPVAPVLLSPASGATDVSITSTLHWSASSAASSFDVFLGNSPTPPLLTTTTATSVAPTNLIAGTTYYWRVAARFSPDISLTSPTSSFSTATAALVPAISPGGVVPLNSMSSTIQPGSWVSVYGTNLALAVAIWAGDYPITLGGVGVTVNGKPAYLWYVSPNQINMEAPDDTATGPVTVVVTTSVGKASATVTLGAVGPSLSLFADQKHPAGVILTPSGSGAYGGGTYDLAGPTGAFAFDTRPAKAGEIVLLYGTGFGPSNPAVPAGRPFSGSAATVYAVQISIGGVSVVPLYSVVTSPGVYQIALTVPNVGSGDQPIRATVNGMQTPDNVFLAVR